MYFDYILPRARPHLGLGFGVGLGDGCLDDGSHAYAVDVHMDAFFYGYHNFLC